MNHEQQHDDIVELGTASLETKGVDTGKDDHAIGLIPFAGLIED